jgi:hypothetical protein
MKSQSHNKIKKVLSVFLVGTLAGASVIMPSFEQNQIEVRAEEMPDIRLTFSTKEPGLVRIVVAHLGPDEFCQTRAYVRDELGHRVRELNIETGLRGRAREAHLAVRPRRRNLDMVLTINSTVAAPHGIDIEVIKALPVDPGRSYESYADDPLAEPGLARQDPRGIVIGAARLPADGKLAIPYHARFHRT